MRRAVRMMRHAISPRFAINNFWITRRSFGALHFLRNVFEPQRHKGDGATVTGRDELHPIHGLVSSEACSSNIRKPASGSS
jgi:hypothetical protein